MSTDTTNTHAELKKLYCQDWLETDKPWERWEYLDDYWRPMPKHPGWYKDVEYRRIDPYRALKEAAKDSTKQIRVKGGEWTNCGYWWKFGYSPDNYEIRDKPVEKKPVKYLCYEGTLGGLYWCREGNEVSDSYTRVPEFDKVLS